jgi:hypothetical protein
MEVPVGGASPEELALMEEMQRHLENLKLQNHTLASRLAAECQKVQEVKKVIAPGKRGVALTASQQRTRQRAEDEENAAYEIGIDSGSDDDYDGCGRRVMRQIRAAPGACMRPMQDAMMLDEQPTVFRSAGISTPAAGDTDAEEFEHADFCEDDAPVAYRCCGAVPDDEVDDIDATAEPPTAGGVDAGASAVARLDLGQLREVVAALGALVVTKGPPPSDAVVRAQLDRLSLLTSHV